MHYMMEKDFYCPSDNLLDSFTFLKLLSTLIAKENYNPNLKKKIRSYIKQKYNLGTALNKIICVEKMVHTSDQFSVRACC